MGNLSISNSESLADLNSRCRKAAIMAAMTVAVLELVFWFSSDPMTGLPYFQPTADDATVVVKHEMLKLSHDDIYVAVGDSSCMMGVVPSVFQQERGERLLNLGTLATFTTAGYSSFGRSLVPAGSRPRAILYVVLPRSFEVTEAQAREYGLLGRYGAAYGVDLGMYVVSPRERALGFFRKHRMNLFPSEFGGSFSVFRERIIHSGGFVPEVGQYVPGGAKRTDFNLSPWALNQFEGLVQDAHRNQVDVFLWFSPRPVGYCTKSYLTQVVNELHPLEEKYPNFHLLQTEVPHWPAECFGSVTHLNAQNAERNTIELALAIEMFQAGIE